MRCLVVSLILIATLPASAQTYTPKAIRIEGGGAMSREDILRTAQLTEGKPVTKQEIEAALGRLGDTGEFTDLGYTVNAAALTLQLTAGPSNKLLPVRYVNLQWWEPEELTKLIQQRVPLYKGELPQTGSLADQVEAAVVELLKQKGVTEATVTTVQSGGAAGATGVGLAVSHPEVVLGDIAVRGSLPTVERDLERMRVGFRQQEFDAQITGTSIPRNITDLYNNNGFLDATTDPATFTAPRKEAAGSGALARYDVDASTTVHPGTLYLIGSMEFDAPPPLSKAEIEKAVAVKKGDPAGTFPLQHASDALAFAYTRHGFLDAKSRLTTRNDSAAHTTACVFMVTPGELYHFAGVDTSALPASLQTAFGSAFRLEPGVPAGDPLNLALSRALTDIHAEKMVRVEMKPNREAHTVVIVLKLNREAHTGLM